MGVVSCGTTMLDQGVFQNIGAVTWDTTAKTAGFTAVSGNGYFVNTTSAAITVTLPAGSAGSIVALRDYANTWNTNNVTIAPNGTDKIGGVNVTSTLDIQGQSVTLIYIDSTRGWQDINDSTSSVQGDTYITATGGTITTSGDYKIHKFTSPGTFTVSSLSSKPALNNVSYMVVGGGGGANGMTPNNSQGGGGGGAGGFREYKDPADSYTASPIAGSPSISVTATAYPITVGGGGAGGAVPVGGATGSNSVFSTITAAGGGNAASGFGTNGGAGGSGGGGNANSGTGGAGNVPPTSPSQGNPGGTGSGGGPQYGAGAGGGATGIGGNGNPPGVNSGVNGTGATTSISATPTLYAEGGGGANYDRPNDPNHSQGSGGNSGFGPYPGPNNNGENGVTNTGGGGGGGSSSGPGGASGGSGGSGIVIIRYKFQ